MFDLDRFLETLTAQWRLTLFQALWVSWAVNIAKAILILVIGWLLVRWGTTVLAGFLRRVMPNSALVTFLASLAYAVLLVVVAVAALSQLGVPTASLLTVLGAAGLALALSLQNSLSNLASGIMILSFQLFRVGDTIEVVGVRGRVVEILIFHTILSTEDGQRVLVPNGKITSEVVRHSSAASERARQAAKP